MKFREWLVMEAATGVIMFHGTSTPGWEGIRKYGLDPNPSQKTWDDDPDASFNAPSRASYGGTYFTQNIITATGSAWRTAKKTGGERVLIAVSVNPRTMLADEDSVTFSLYNVPIPGAMTTDGSATDLYIAMMLQENPGLASKVKFQNPNAWKSQVDKSRNEYVEKAFRGLSNKLKDMHPELQKSIRQVLFDFGFRAALTRLVAHAHPDSRDYAARGYQDGLQQDIFRVGQRT